MSKLCVHCGAPLHDQAAFCHSCAAPQMEKRCPAMPCARWKRRTSAAGAILLVALLTVLVGNASIAGSSADAQVDTRMPTQETAVSPAPEKASVPVTIPSPTLLRTVAAVTTEPPIGERDPEETPAEEPTPEETAPAEHVPDDPAEETGPQVHTEKMLTARLLGDDRLAELKDADAKTLQTEIGTVADAVAYLDQFDGVLYDAIDSDFKMNIEWMLELHRTEATACDLYTAFTGWCLADDFPEGEYLLALGQAPGFLRIYHGLLLPVEEGYRVICPSAYSARWNCVWGFDEMTVASREELVGQLHLRHDGAADDSGFGMYHLLTTALGRSEMSFWMSGTELVSSCDVQELFRAEN